MSERVDENATENVVEGAFFEPSPVYVALVHYPVYNLPRQKVATALTNLDLHDLARLGRTFGVRRVYMVSPISAQQALAGEIVAHWVTGAGGKRNSRRRQAMLRVGVAADIGAAVTDITAREGRRPEVVATGANFGDDAVSFAEARRRLRERDVPVLIVFGTGWGLHEEALDQCDWRLAPVIGVDDYNHLAVRTAAGIIMDRLLSRDGVGIQGEGR